MADLISMQTVMSGIRDNREDKDNTFETHLQAEWEQAKAKGFSGSLDDYLAKRDYT